MCDVFSEESVDWEDENDDFLFAKNQQNTDNIYPQADIKVERNQFSLYELNRKFKKNQLILDPEFQREAVWVKDQQSELIESVLMGIPLPMFYFNETKEGKLVIVDGKQRLTTFFSYFDNKFKLKKLKILKECNEKKFDDLEGKSQSSLEDFQIVAQIIKPSTPDRIMFDIFDRVNRGGTSLNNQEMRNALYLGKSTQLLKKLTDSKEFKDATCNSINSTRMKDRYLVSRLISFSLLNEEKLTNENNEIIKYNNDIDEFLGKSMEYLNRLDDSEINQIEKLFLKSMYNNYVVFEGNAFRRLPNGNRKNPINMILFEAFGYLFTKFEPSFCERNKMEIKTYCDYLLSDTHLNRLLTDDRGRSIVINEVFKMFNDLKEKIVNDIKN